jgi:hypothetical protein
VRGGARKSAEGQGFGALNKAARVSTEPPRSRRREGAAQHGSSETGSTD